MKPTDTDTTVFEIAAAHTAPAIAPGEIIIGTLAGINAQGQPLVVYPENPAAQPLVAISTLGITQQQAGRQVALLFANGDPQKPVIMGLIHSPLHDIIDAHEVVVTAPSADSPAEPARNSEKDLTIDGKRIVIEGSEEIVLRCGDASITLTKSGKILIRGKYLLSRSEGVNRIMGGSVQVN